MKKSIILILVISFCLVMAGSAIAAEKVKAGAVKATDRPMTPAAVTITPTTTCPPNFDVISTNPLSCKRRQPSNPCPSGFIVKWGPGCSPNLGSFGANADAMNTDPQYANCAFRCVPQKPNFTITCPSGSTPYVGFCEAGCQMPPQ